ncbi:hypothetical protein AAGW05_16560 [Arthrobacter sp. LAPM80]|uniref:hypothetical protein n=1 Tax=Arthrobacter sp. LAPM80 TaxID=3141788 RepID=UPI00398A790A
MPEQPSVFDVGFADFVAVLLLETLESIVAAHTSQEERLSSLQEAAELTVEEFAQTGISVELIDMSATQLFPDDGGGTTLLTGGPVPGKDALDELAVTLRRGDTDEGGLTQAGVAHVRKGLALYLARRQLAALKEAQSRGIPRVLVEGGTLRAKLNFTAVDIGSRNTSEGRAEPTSEKPPSRQIAPILTARQIPGLSDEKLRSTLLAWDTPLQSDVLNSIRRTRLVVSTPDVLPGGSKPADTSWTEVFGEVEIRFRMEQ